MKITRLFNHPDSFLYFFAISASIFLSFALNMHDAPINPDGICYLLSAQEIGVAGLHSAMHLCDQAKWPFYPFLIHVFAPLMHGHYLSSAYFLDGFFSLLSVLFFILIVKTLGGTKRMLWLSALLILTAPSLNAVRADVIRDHGFWAFYLIAIYSLLSYFRVPSGQKALLFSMSMVMATLFRIEGAVFLLCLPFLSFLITGHWRTRCRRFFALNGITLGLGLLLGAWFLMHAPQRDQLGRLTDLVEQFHHGIGMMFERYHSMQSTLIQSVLPTDAKSDVGLIICLFFFSWYGLNVISNLSLIYTVLLMYAWLQKSVFAKTDRLVLTAYIIINIAITATFLAEHLFLSKRYLIALSLTLMLWLPFALDRLICQRIVFRYRLSATAIFLFMLLSLGGSFWSFGHSKAYIPAAGQWLAETVPAQATLYTNDYQLMYYSQHFGKHLFSTYSQYQHLDTIAQAGWKHYDYIALRLRKAPTEKVHALLKEMHLTPLQVFSNQQGDHISIYKIAHNLS